MHLSASDGSVVHPNPPSAFFWRLVTFRCGEPGPEIPALLRALNLPLDVFRNARILLKRYQQHGIGSLPRISCHASLIIGKRVPSRQHVA